MSELAATLAALIAETGDEMHWTVVLDRALKAGLVRPSSDARSLVQAALLAATKDGLVTRTSTGTYCAPVAD